MKFKLQQEADGRSGPSGMTTFSVLDEKNVVRGTVSVPSAEADDLVKCWRGVYAPAAKQPDRTAALAKAIMAAKQPMTASKLKAMALRGS